MTILRVQLKCVSGASDERRRHYDICGTSFGRSNKLCMRWQIRVGDIACGGRYESAIYCVADAMRDLEMLRDKYELDLEED